MMDKNIESRLQFAFHPAFKSIKIKEGAFGYLSIIFLYLLKLAMVAAATLAVVYALSNLIFIFIISISFPLFGAILTGPAFSILSLMFLIVAFYNCIKFSSAEKIDYGTLLFKDKIKIYIALSVLSCIIFWLFVYLTDLQHDYTL